MFAKFTGALLLFPALLRIASAQNSSSIACNNSPLLCSRAYNNVTYLGAHDSPFVRDAANGYTDSGNQYYDSTTQLSAGVRLLSAQVQWSSNTSTQSLHVCHTDCSLYDGGPLSTWLGQVKTWMDANPHEVVTILLVNGADATSSELAAEYSAAGITTALAYTPAESTSGTQDWPTLQTLINSGTRLLNFVASISYNAGDAPYLMDEWTYIFENNYNNNAPTAFTCEANRPPNVANNTALALRSNLMPLMNHFLYSDTFFGVQMPNSTYAATVNAPSGGVGNLGTAATQCTSYYGHAPTFILVDFFNEGPAIATVDRLNGVTHAVGRKRVSRGIPKTSAAADLATPAWTSLVGALSMILSVWVLV